MQPEFDPNDLLRVLVAHGVDFIVVGGVASVLAGSPVSTQDLDVVHQRSSANLDRLVTALRELRAVYRDPAGRRIEPDVEKLAAFRLSLLETPRGRLDVLRAVGAGLEYEDLLERSIEYDLGDFRVRALDVETLIETKALAGRPKDLYALGFLREIARRGPLKGD